MIHYEPHPHWLRDVWRLPKTPVARASVISTLLASAYAASVTALIDVAAAGDIPHGAAAFSVLGGITSIALAFRLNNAKTRWWEGRLHWGFLVNHARNLAALVACFWDPADAAGRRRMAGLLGDFAIGLSGHLRDRFDSEELASLTAAERTEASRREHPMSLLATLVWSEIERRRAAGELSTAQVLELQPHARALLDVLGACERIRRTPIPFAATSAIRWFFLAFTAFVPVGLHAEFGWLCVPIAAVVHFALAVMDKLAAELEDPFGLDAHDLPTRFIAEAIRRQTHEIVGVTVDTVDVQPRSPRQYQLVA